jgi:hypothetical protein
MASGGRALNHDTENVRATIKPSSRSTGDVVDVRLLRSGLPQELKNISIRHILPVHPSTESLSSSSVAKQYLVFLKGPLKGEVRVMDRIEGDRIWVKNPADKKLTEHSRFDFVLSRHVKPKGSGKGR